MLDINIRIIFASFQKSIHLKIHWLPLDVHFELLIKLLSESLN